MWNSRTLIPPPTNFLPPSASSDESSWLALISTLRSIQENQELSGPLLKGEQMTLSRLLYKSKNSQRRWKVYQLLVKLNKCLERLTEVPVCSYAALMASGCKQQGRKRTVTVTVKDPALPSQQMLDYLCVSLQGCAKLSIHITGLCQQAAVIIVQTLHSGMFISNNIILLSLVSRIRVLACNFLKTAIGWYDTLLPLRSCLSAANAEWLDKETELPLTLTEWLGEEAKQLFALPERSAATSKSDILEKLFQGDIEIDLLAGSGERWVKTPNQSRTQNDLEIDLLAESRERSVTTLVQSLIETQTPAIGTDLGEKLSVAELAAMAAAANKKKGNAATANAANEAKRQARAFHLPSKKKMKKDFEGPVDQLVKSAKFMKSEALLKTKHKVKKVLSSVKRGYKLTRKRKADASTEKVGQKTKGKKRRFKGRKVPPFGIRQAGNYSRLQSGGDTLDSRTGNTWKVALDGIRPGNAMEISVEGAVRKVTRKASTSRQSKVALAFRRSLSRESAGSGGSGGILGSKRRRRLQARIAKIQRRRSSGGGVASGGVSSLDSLVISNQAAAAKSHPSSVSHQHAESVMLQNAFQHGNHSHMPKEHSNLQKMKRNRQVKSDTGSKKVSGTPGNSAQPFGPSVPNPASLISRGDDRIGLGVQLTKKDKMLKRLQKLKQKFIGKGKRKPGVRFVPGSLHFGNPLASPFSGEQRQGLVRQQERQSGQRCHGSSDHQPHQQRRDQIHSHNGSFQQRQDGHLQHQRQKYQQPQNSQPPHHPPPPLPGHHLPLNRIEQHPFPHNHHHQHQQRHHHHMEQQSDARMQNSMPRPMPRRQKKSGMGDCRKPVGREKKPGGNGQASTDLEIDLIFSDLF